MHVFPDEARVKYLIGLTAHTLNQLISEKVEEAPTDGYQYVRKGGKWAKISGGGGGQSYYAGYGIAIDDDNNISVDADVVASKESVESLKNDVVLTKDVTAQATVGYIEKGTVLPSGTSFTKFVDMLLNPELGVTPVLPKAVLTINGNSEGTYEIGTNISLNYSVKYTDGYFKAVDAWGDNQAAGCPSSTVTYLFDGTAITDHEKGFVITDETTHKATAKVEYGASTKTPVTNKGNQITDSTGRIDAGVATSKTFSYTGRYCAFIATLDGDVSVASQIDVSEVRGGEKFELNPGGDTVLHEGEIFTVPGNKKTTVIAVPEEYELEDIEDSLGISYKAAWESQGVISMSDFKVAGGIKHAYKLYRYYNAGTSDLKQTNVTITRI